MRWHGTLSPLCPSHCYFVSLQLVVLLGWSLRNSQLLEGPACSSPPVFWKLVGFSVSGTEWLQKLFNDPIQDPKLQEGTQWEPPGGVAERPVQKLSLFRDPRSALKFFSITWLSLLSQSDGVWASLHHVSFLDQIAQSWGLHSLTSFLNILFCK